MKYTLILFSLLLNAALIYISFGIRFDNSIWLGDENPHKKNKDYLYTEFDRGEDLVVVINLGVDFFQPRFITIFSQITEELEEEDGVVEVKNPLSATTIIQHNKIMQILSFKEALEQKIISNLAEYKERFTASEYYGQLLSKDYQKLALVIKIEAPLAEYNHARRDRILKAARRILDAHLGKDMGSHLQSGKGIGKRYFTGEVRLNHSLAEFTEKNLFMLLPIVIFLIFFLLYFVFRRIIEVLAVIYIALTVLGLSFAAFVLRDYPMTAVSISLPVLILVIAVADAIHIFNRWHELAAKSSDQKGALRQTIRETWLPCLLTSLTTGIGFGSFYFSELIPLRNFGELSLIVIMLAYVVIVSHMWFFLWFFKDHLKHRELELHPRLGNLLTTSYSAFTQVRYRSLLVFVALSSVIAAYSFYFVRTETNFLDVFFKKDSKIHKDFDYVDEHLGGTGSVDILLRSKETETFKQIHSLHTLESAQKILLGHEQVNYMRSYLTPLRMIHKEFAVDLGLDLKDKKNTLPQNENQLAQELLFLEFSRGDSKNDVLSPYIDFDYTNSRIHLQTPNLNSSAARKIKLHIQDKLSLGPAQDYIISGSSIYFETLGSYVIDTQLLSILITLAVIWIFFVILFRFKLASIGVLVNVFAHFCLQLSIIIYLDIPFDFATVLISSVSFGLCVDDTIHFLHFYHLQKKRLPDFDACIKSVIRMIGRPIFFTSVLFSCGFIVFALADLVILIKFGIFTLLSLVFAFFANVIILPAFLKFADKKRKKTRHGDAAARKMIFYLVG